MTLFPIFLKLAGKRCLVVGAGKLAESKIESLISSGAIVVVVAPRATHKLELLNSAKKIEWKRREFVTNDLDQIFMVIAATDTQAVNHSVADEARVRGILCNSVDDPPDCDFFYPSVVQRGDLQIAISTAGKSPSLAQRLRIEIDHMIPEDTGGWLDALGEQRSAILRTLPAGEERKEVLHQLARREHCDPHECPVQRQVDKIEEGRQRASREIPDAGGGEEGSARSGVVYLVGAGPGSADLLTVRARDLIVSADCILHDDLVSDEIVWMARSDARVINVGKRCGTKSITQEQIHELMITESQAGLSVVRLKSGDPMLFGRGTEEMAALRHAGIAFEVVPGVSAGFAAAAAVGQSLTDRHSASRAVLMTRHLAADKRSSFAGLDPSSAIVLYMPGKDYHALQDELITSGWPGDTTCIVVSSASTAAEKIVETSLEKLSEVAPPPAPVVILILPPYGRNGCESLRS